MFTSQMEHTMLINIFFISYIQRPVTLFLATLRVQCPVFTRTEIKHYQTQTDSKIRAKLSSSPSLQRVLFYGRRDTGKEQEGRERETLVHLQRFECNRHNLYNLKDD